MFTLTKTITKLNSSKLAQILPRFNFCHHHNDNCGHFSKTIVRKKAPDFAGNAYWNGEFKKLNLKSFEGKWVCLFFYPLDFTFVCPTEIVDFNNSSEVFSKLSKTT